MYVWVRAFFSVPRDSFGLGLFLSVLSVRYVLDLYVLSGVALRALYDRLVYLGLQRAALHPRYKVVWRNCVVVRLHDAPVHSWWCDLLFKVNIIYCNRKKLSKNKQKFLQLLEKNSYKNAS
jgi:hypothetical protein